MVIFKPGPKGVETCQIEHRKEGHPGERNSKKYTLKFFKTIKKTEYPNHYKECSKERAPLRKKAKLQRSDIICPVKLIF